MTKNEKIIAESGRDEIIADIARWNDLVDASDEVSSHPYLDFVIKIFKHEGKFVFALYDTDENNTIDQRVHIEHKLFEDEEEAIENAEILCEDIMNEIDGEFDFDDQDNF